MRQVIVVPYDPQWPAAFERAAREVSEAMGQGLLAIHHIGSTSIPGIHAKPVIDMLAIARDLPSLDERAEQMRSIGYEVMGEFGIDGRRYFRRNNAAGVRTEHVHSFTADSRHVRWRSVISCALTPRLRRSMLGSSSASPPRIHSISKPTWMEKTHSSARLRRGRWNG